MSEGYLPVYKAWDTGQPPIYLLLKKLTYLEAQLKASSQEIGEVKQQLHLAHNQSRPISRLPVELLSKIFDCTRISEERDYGRGYWSYWDEALEMSIGSRPGGPPYIGPPPSLPLELRISQVCQYWKAIAEETYTLWQTLALPHSSSKFYHSHEISHIRRYTQNSKSAELSIRIHLRYFTLWKKIWPFLRPTLHRWKRFSISSGHWSPHRLLYRVFVTLQSQSAPILEDLCISQIVCSDDAYLEEERRTRRRRNWRPWSFNDDDSQDGETNLLIEYLGKRKTRKHHPTAIFRGGAPMLKSLRTGGVMTTVGDFADSGFPNEDFYSSIEPTIIIMPSLTTLCLDNVVNYSWSAVRYDLVAILVACPSIQSLSIQGDVGTQAIAAGELELEKYVLPNLKSLRLSPQRQVSSPPVSVNPLFVLDTYIFRSFFADFQTPNLETIIFRHFRFLNIHAELPIPSVKTIKIEDSFSPFAFTSAFQHLFPNAERLDLAYACLDPSPQYEAERSVVDWTMGGVARSSGWPLSEIRIWVDNSNCYDILKLRRSLDAWNHLRWQEEHGRTDNFDAARGTEGWTRLRLQISDVPRSFPKFLLTDHVSELEVLDSKLGRPAMWP